MSKNVFIFVVCGSKEHIDTLHFSLNHLNRFSKNEIWVLTDSTRNEIPIVHTSVIDLKTPDAFNHHQASIYLKTGIHKFVPKGNLYCYLDSDVIALSENVERIFDEYIAPIRFAPDHCKLMKFSPYAVNCGCMADWDTDRDVFNKALDIHDKNKQISDPEILIKAKELQLLFDRIKKSIIKKIATAIRYFFSYPIFKLDDSFYFDRKSRTWHSSNHNIVMYEVDVKKIEQETGFKYNRLSQKWINKKGVDIWQDECKHLADAIHEKFDINIPAENWQHWNGGVFLFDDNSHDFLETWHKYTMEIFKDTYWKTRDQGTLIATVMKFNLQNHPVLDKKWNLIADYHNPYLQWTDLKNVQISHSEFVSPIFLHVYHHFGDNSWKFWKMMPK